jgi:hypothetical protein
LLAAPTAAAQQDRVDAHVHYNRETWSIYAPHEAIALLEQAGVRWALVSSTPDDGTLSLYAAAPHLVVPMLRPYRRASDFLTWTTDASVLEDIDARPASGIPYQGIGEFELAPGQARDVVPARLADVAAERGLWLQAHAGPHAIGELASLRSDVHVVWAHAGVDTSPEDGARVLDMFPNVWVEISLRAAEIAPDGVLEPSWRALFEQRAERVLLGSDTWLPRDWTALPGTHAAMQAWLDQLAPEVAEQIASGNAERLFHAPSGDTGETPPL